MSSVTTTDGRQVRSRGQKTRARLLAAATKVFERKGFHAARVDDIVKEAKTSHGTFYVYFESKESLFDELVTEVGAEMADIIGALPTISPDDPESRQALRTWLARFGEFYARSGAVLRTWTEIESPDDAAGAAGSDLLHALGDALGPKFDIDTGTPKKGRIDPAIAALALMAMVERFHYYASTGQLKADADEVLDTLCDVMMASLDG